MKTKDGFISILKGALIGVISLVSYVSPASIIISLNSYENILLSLENPKENKDRVVLVLIPMFIGIALGLLKGKELIKFLTSNYNLHVSLFIIAIILGGIKVNYNKNKIHINKNNIILFLITLFVTISSFIFLKDKSLVINNRIINSFVLGMKESISFLLPPFTNVLSLILKEKLYLLIISIITMIITFILFAKLINYLKNKNILYPILYGLLISNIVIIIMNIIDIKVTFSYIFTSVLAFLWGLVLAINIEKEQI